MEHYCTTNEYRLFCFVLSFKQIHQTIITSTKRSPTYFSLIPPKIYFPSASPSNVLLVYRNCVKDKCNTTPKSYLPPNHPNHQMYNMYCSIYEHSIFALASRPLLFSSSKSPVLVSNGDVSTRLTITLSCAPFSRIGLLYVTIPPMIF